GNVCSHSIAAVGDPASCAFQISPDPSWIAAAAVLRAWTSSPAKQIPSDTSTLPSPFDAVTSPRHTKHGSVDTYSSDRRHPRRPITSRPAALVGGAPLRGGAAPRRGGVWASRSADHVIDRVACDRVVAGGPAREVPD